MRRRLHALRARRARRRDERGAVAIIVAFFLVVLFGLAAMAVDLGHGFLQRQDVQKDADFAALYGAAGSNLPGTTGGGCGYGPNASASDQAVQDVATYLNNHVDSNPDTTVAQWVTAPTAGGLVDCDLTNGEVLYGTVSESSTGGINFSYDRYHLTVITPERAVDYMFAPVMDNTLQGTEVSARATAAIRSPAIGSVPLYAHNGCDWGRQTISQPNLGQSASTVQVSHPTETNAADLSGIATDPASNPPTITQPAPDPSPLTINGTNLDQVTHVGFFENGGGEPVTVAAVDFASRTASSIRLSNVPAAVTSVSGDWYVRVKIGTNWSRVADQQGNLKAPRLLVGNPTLTCGQGPSNGNFGTIRFIPSWGGGSTTDQIAKNIAKGLEHTLAVHPSPVTTGLCTGQSVDVHWPNDGTNCVNTDPGMAADAAEKGFIRGVGAIPGRLRDLSSGRCDHPPTPANAVVRVKNIDYVINNDTLSCFFTDTTTNVGTVSAATYSGGPVISAEIFDSPRFMLVPVLKVEPTSGTSQTYQIVAFRPAFLTDQPNSASRDSAPSGSNGLTIDPTGQGALRSVQVVFINANALPPIDVAQTTAYAGSGLRVIRLVD